MSLPRIPPEGHEVYALIRDTPLATITIEQVLALPDIRAARRAAKKYFDNTPLTQQLFSLLMLRTDGSVVLKTFGRRGGHRTRWNFGRWRSDPPDAYGIAAARIMQQSHSETADQLGAAITPHWTVEHSVIGKMEVRDGVVVSITEVKS